MSSKGETVSNRYEIFNIGEGYIRFTKTDEEDAVELWKKSTKTRPDPLKILELIFTPKVLLPSSMNTVNQMMNGIEYKAMKIRFKGDVLPSPTSDTEA